MLIRTEEELTALALKAHQLVTRDPEIANLTAIEGIAVFATMIYMKGITDGIDTLKKSGWGNIDGLKT